MISYEPLWHTLVRKGLKKKDLASMAGISSCTMSRLGKNKSIGLDMVERICSALQCGMADVVELKATDKDDANEGDD